MSHALLLRLFLSPSFFSVHVALRYLRTYSDNIGITYYLTRRLRELDTRELNEVWGFICHLLVTRPSKSRALECFVVEVVQRSTHIAMITLWFMQATLQDLAPTRHNTQSFVICQRVLHKCHEVIFGDLPTLARVPYVSLNLPPQSRLARRKVRAHSEPVLIGMGMILAGAPGMPRLTEVMGEVAIEQGRMQDEAQDPQRLVNEDEDMASGVGTVPTSPADEEDEEEHSTEDQPVAQLDAFGRPITRSASLDRRQTVGPARTSPALPLHLRILHKPRLSDDPLGQNDPPSPTNSPSAFSSSPSISTSRQVYHTSTLSGADILLQQYDLQAQSHLLRSHYCRSEVKFLLTLESISNRLLVIPRPARVSALRAELTALNHKLPAEVCMPMWCSSSDTPRLDGVSQPHHRIVRIPPGESVVLNSAERAPYLLLMEILSNDLDFDPVKRANKEIVKRIVKKENERKGASGELITFNALLPTQRQGSIQRPGVARDSMLGEDITEAPGAIPSITANGPDLPGEEEEMDLVEQLFGSNQSVRRTIDLSESIVLPPAPKNKELDMVAWSRSSSIPPSPSLEPGTPFGQSSAAGFGTGNNFPVSRQSTPRLMEAPGTTVLSLDEYSERMRTAAVMLAQLNANLVRESVVSIPTIAGVSTNPNTPSSNSGSWLPGSSWLSSANVQASSGGPLHPSLAGSQPAAAALASSATSSRLKVQHAEAAAIRDRIMAEMLALEEERMERMRENRDADGMMRIGDVGGGMKTEDEGIIRRELNRADPSAVVFSESWAAKKSRIRHGSPYGHLANWDCVSVIVKTGGDLRQEQLAVQLIQQFEHIWQEEKCGCWVRYFRILITGATSGLVETITDAVSIHSIKKAEYARRLADGRLGHVTLFDHFKNTYGHPSSAKFVRAQRNFAKSLAGYSIVCYILQIKDRHNGNILLDREGHLIHIDFGFMLSNSPGNIGFEAAPFKLPPEYIEVLGGVDGEQFLVFKQMFREGFEAARKHCDRIITLVELMQKDSAFPCFAALGEQTVIQLKDRFQPALTHSLIGDYVNGLIDSSLGSNWTRLYDSYQYYSQSIL